VGYYQRAILNGRRVSAYRAFLHKALSRPNLEVRTNARASEVVLEGTRAVGVRYLRERGGPATLVRARREVILSGGTANTARLLQVSGIGPASCWAGWASPCGTSCAGWARTSATTTRRAS
jgi:choline dehydrogenase